MAFNDLVGGVDQYSCSRDNSSTRKQNREKANLIINDDLVNVGIPKCFLELLVSINKNRSKN